MNIVRNTNAEGTETYRERSRIGSINHRIWSVIAPMLFIAFGLFGVNVNAWGADCTYKDSFTGNSVSGKKKLNDLQICSFTAPNPDAVIGVSLGLNVDSFSDSTSTV